MSLLSAEARQRSWSTHSSFLLCAVHPLSGQHGIYGGALQPAGPLCGLHSVGPIPCGDPLRCSFSACPAQVRCGGPCAGATLADKPSPSLLAAPPPSHRLQRVDSGEGGVALPRSFGPLLTPETLSTLSGAVPPPPIASDDVDSVTGGVSAEAKLRALEHSNPHAPLFGATVPDLDSFEEGDWLQQPLGDLSPVHGTDGSTGAESAGGASSPPLFDYLGLLADDATAAGVDHAALFTPSFTRDLAVADATAMAAASISATAGVSRSQRAQAAALAAKARLAAVAAMRGAAIASMSTGVPATQLLPFTGAAGASADQTAQEDDADALFSKDMASEAGLLPGSCSELVPHEAVRFNRGFFARRAQDSGIDVYALAQRVKDLLLTEDSSALFRATSQSSGSLPVRLVESVSPELQRLLVHHLRASAGVAHALAPSVQRNLAYDFVFDGLHLTMGGLAAVVVAFDEDEDEALSPDCVPIVMASTRSVRTAEDGGASATTPPNESSQRRWHMAQDLLERAGQTVLPLSMLFARFPHLPRLAAEAAPADLAACSAYLSALGSGLSRPPPVEVVELYRRHIQQLAVPTIRVLFPANTHLPLAMHMNTAAARLFGLSAETLRKALTSPHPDRSRSLNWTHPSILLRRVLASVGSKNHGLFSYQFEGQYLRIIHTPTGHPMDAPEPLYSPFYGVETAHREVYPDGSTCAVTSYFSDVVFTRQRVGLSQLRGSTSELDAIESLILNGQQYPEVKAAMRRQGTSCTSVALWSSLDYSSRRVLLRALSIAFGSAPSPVLPPSAAGGQSLPSSQMMHGVSVSARPGGAPGSVHTLNIGQAEDERGAGADHPTEGATQDPVQLVLGNPGMRSLMRAFEAHAQGGPAVNLHPLDIAQLSGLFETYQGMTPLQQAHVVVKLPAGMAAMVSAILGVPPPSEDLLREARGEPPAAVPGVPQVGSPDIPQSSQGALDAAADSAPAASAGLAGEEPLPAAERDMHMEAQAPAERLLRLQPLLRKAVGDELMKVVRQEMLSSLSVQREHFLNLNVGDDVLRIVRAPSVVTEVASGAEPGAL